MFIWSLAWHWPSWRLWAPRRHTERCFSSDPKSEPPENRIAPPSGHWPDPDTTTDTGLKITLEIIICTKAKSSGSVVFLTAFSVCQFPSFSIDLQSKGSIFGSWFEAWDVSCWLDYHHGCFTAFGFTSGSKWRVVCGLQVYASLVCVQLFSCHYRNRHFIHDNNNIPFIKTRFKK